MDSVKCSRRRLRVSTEPLLVFLALALVLAQSAGAQPADASQRGVVALDAFLDGIRSLTADFKQELYAADQRLLETETGTLSLQRPNRFRWSYVAPTELVTLRAASKSGPFSPLATSVNSAESCSRHLTGMTSAVDTGRRSTANPSCSRSSGAPPGRNGS